MLLFIVNTQLHTLWLCIMCSVYFVVMATWQNKVDYCKHCFGTLQHSAHNQNDGRAWDIRCPEEQHGRLYKKDEKSRELVLDLHSEFVNGLHVGLLLATSKDG